MTRPATKRTMKAIMPKISSHICLLLRSLSPRDSLYLYFFCSGYHTTGGTSPCPLVAAREGMVQSRKMKSCIHEMHVWSAGKPGRQVPVLFYACWDFLGALRLVYHATKPNGRTSN